MTTPPLSADALAACALLGIDPRRLALLSHLVHEGESSTQELIDASGYGRGGVNHRIGALRDDEYLADRREVRKHTGAPTIVWDIDVERVQREVVALFRALTPPSEKPPKPQR